MATTIHGWARVDTDRVLVKRFLGALFAGDVPSLAGAMASDCVVHHVARGEDFVGAEALVASVEGTGLSDVTVELVETVADDDRLAVYATIRGRTVTPTRDGTSDVAPTGWQREVSQFGIYRIEDDHVVEAWLLSQPVEEAVSDETDAEPGRSLGGRIAAWFRGE